MAEVLTPQQHAAVHNSGGKLLISAAAGSGKTKVLVDRLLNQLTESNGSVNIDDFLIITYTKAAAAELRGKIASKMNEKLAQDPGNKHLQKQVQRLYLTNISTVHAFCADLLKAYAYRLDIPGDFRVADERECLLLQLSVMDRLMNTAFAEADPDFLTFVDSQEIGRDDRIIPQIILQIYNSARCHLDPENWLQGCIDSASTGNLTDASETLWGAYLIADLHQYLDMQIDAIAKCAQLAARNGTMEKPALLLQDTFDRLSQLRSYYTWDDIVRNCTIDYGTLRFSKNCTDLSLAEQIKSVRKACKEGVEKKLRPFADLSDQVLADLDSCCAATRGLIQMVKKFSDEYDRIKKARRILDFSDLEHKTLDLLTGTKRNGPTAVAREIGDRFHEIMVDEYQDSNAVQDGIFSALTHQRNNCFMVGDVKQSIYQFRLADPDIFIEKYNTYVPAEDAAGGQGRKILLSHNFRSAAGVIDAVNDVFSGCMTPKVGGLYYTEEEMLREGIPHIENSEQEIELYAIEVQQDTYEEEAAFTAQRICQLLDGKHMVRQGDQLRPIVAEDIVILLRSPGSVGGEFKYALESRGIKVNAGSGTDLMETEEISVLRSLLQIIDNPLQDIPLVAVLCSRIFCFSADDLAVIRSQNKYGSVYESLEKSSDPKAVSFLRLLDSLRYEAKVDSLSHLLDKIFSLTRMDAIYASFTDGAVKKANLQAFCQLVSQCEGANMKELSQLIDFLDSMEEKGVSVASENRISDAVTIMSIHKSKGLEFPVVFLCGLSRDFNREDTKAQVLCNKELGIGLSCVDLINRVRYPSIAKKAIASKMLSDSLSEEMRVLYVAMTRARDRLIMTYAAKNLSSDIEALVNRMDICSSELITSAVNCPGTWILYSALKRTEAGELFALGGRPDGVRVFERPWKICVENNAVSQSGMEQVQEDRAENISCADMEYLKESLSFQYPYKAATAFPSKVTATQLKGRLKDSEVSDNAACDSRSFHIFRKASFAKEDTLGATAFGNAVHCVMQHIRFDRCTDPEGIAAEISRLARENIIQKDAAEQVDAQMLWKFFSSALGERLKASENVLREFKFSVLVDGDNFDPNMKEEKVLLQGVVDCAIIEPDGITVIDFKTDSVTEDTLNQYAEQYHMQIKAYAQALSRIFCKEVSSAQLYFFKCAKFVQVI